MVTIGITTDRNEPEEQQDHHHHDHHRLGDGLEHLLDRSGDGLGRIVDQVDGHALRQGRRQVGQGLQHVGGHVQLVLAGGGT
jgi:hypothetical protein